MRTLLLSFTAFTAATLFAQPDPPLLERLKDENARGADMDHRKFNLHVKMNYKAGQKLPLDLIRGGHKMRLDLPLQ
tara:strand:- start:657 stop:884 length:228 start_codon:yes stop_codon:yes gene_type:complete